MMRRWVPPAYSPVSPASLMRGALSASRLSPSDEDEIRRFVSQVFGARSVLLTDSGTSALALALRAAVAPGDAVAFPGYCCIDLITAAQGAGITVRLYDVDPATLSPDLDSLRAVIARGVSALVITPLFGYPIDVMSVRTIAAEAGIPVIEDAAQGAGATVNGIRTGSFGALSVLSFSRGKGTTGGSGGALLVHDSSLVERVQQLQAEVAPASSGSADIAKLGAQWLLGRPSLYWLPASIPGLRLGEMIYHPPHPPSALSRAASAILMTALRLDGAEIAARRARARRIMAAADHASRFRFVRAAAGGEPGFLRLAVRDLRGNSLPAPRSGVLRGYPITLDEHEASTSVIARGESAGPGARELRDRLFTAPVHSRMSERDLQAIVGWLTAGPPPVP